MAYVARIEATFEAAHALRSYKGKPEPLHGHSWKVEVEVETSGLDAEGMSVDFVELRASLETLLRRFDHRCLNEASPFTEVTPSAENLARWLAGEINPSVCTAGGILREVRVWEGPRASVGYRP